MKSMMSLIKSNHLCIGCGLCEAEFGEYVKVELDHTGKYQLNIIKDLPEERQKCFETICPVISGKYGPTLWGTYLKCFFGFSNDEKIRYKSSSGGILTQTLAYLLREHKVDAVLQIGVDKENPLNNISYICTAESDVLNHSGSRYAPAKLLSALNVALDKFERIAIVGKPCDIRAVTNYLEVYPEKKKKIYLKVSFFCGGIPSQKATERILEKLNIAKNEVCSLDYRGNGWPGLTTVVSKGGAVATMEYNQSWGEILGRDIHKYCKFCPDGLGEDADFCCGDGWYAAHNGYPDFQEKDGRNIIICRTEQGVGLLEEMKSKGVITLESIHDVDTYLKTIQIGQYYRKTSLWGKVLAMKMCFQYIPMPSMHVLWNWRGDKNLVKQMRIMLGTLKRYFAGKL